MVTFGCEDPPPKNESKNERKLIEWVSVQGRCKEDHTTQWEEGYLGSISHWYNITKNKHSLSGSVVGEMGKKFIGGYHPV
jgi:hypothetical protein